MDNCCGSGPNIHYNYYFSIYLLFMVSFKMVWLAIINVHHLYSRCYKKRHLKYPKQLKTGNNKRPVKEKKLKDEEETMFGAQLNQPAPIKTGVYCEHCVNV